LAVFFKTKITPDALTNHLIREHQAIFGQSRLDRICKRFDLHFADDPSHREAFSELQAYGLYSIAEGARAFTETAILKNLFEKFAAVSGPKWEMMLRRIAEYDEFGGYAPAGEIAVRNIFRTAGVDAKSMEGFELRHLMNRMYIDSLKAVTRIFKQYKV
jgi:hypothetical protein